MSLSAVVIGAGWAGQGHTLALQHLGVDVSAICARNYDVVSAVARKLGVAEASANWKQTIERLRPDIVAVTTPASLRAEPIELAAAMGCHIACEKPLAVNASEAKDLLYVVEQARIQHAYAATHRYDPGITVLKDLLENKENLLSEVKVEMILDLFKPDSPWTWFDSLAHGGGVLNNGLPHIFAMLERIFGRLMHANGETACLRNSAPYYPIHDFRMALGQPLDEPGNDAKRPCNADTKVQCDLHFTEFEELSVHLNLDLFANNISSSNGWYFKGAKASYFADGIFKLDIYNYNEERKGKRYYPKKHLPQIGEDEINKWGAFYKDFISSIHGAEVDMLTFRDGYRYQQIIDRLRSHKE